MVREALSILLEQSWSFPKAWWARKALSSSCWVHVSLAEPESLLLPSFLPLLARCSTAEKVATKRKLMVHPRNCKDASSATMLSWKHKLHLLSSSAKLEPGWHPSSSLSKVQAVPEGAEREAGLSKFRPNSDQNSDQIQTKIQTKLRPNSDQNSDHGQKVANVQSLF